MKIYAPVKDFNGLRNNVRFKNGVGETDDPVAIEWFKTHGYSIEMSDKTANLVIEKSDDQIEVENDEDETVEMMGYPEKSPDFEGMTPLELRDWAKANGLGGAIKNIRNKEKLLEIIRG